MATHGLVIAALRVPGGAFCAAAWQRTRQGGLPSDADAPHDTGNRTEELFMAKAAKTHTTRNDVPSNAKQVSIGVLQACLVDTIDLYNATRQAHWNVKGPHFG